MRFDNLADGSEMGIRLDDSTRVLVARIWHDYMREQIGKILVGVFCMIVIAASVGAQARLVEPALDKVLVEGSRTLLWALPLAFLGVAIVKGFATYGQSVLMQMVGLRVIATMQSQMFQRLVESDLAFMQGDATGKLLSRFTSDVNFLRDAIVKSITGMARDFLIVVVLVGVMFYTDWRLAAVAFVVFPISVVPIVKIGRRLRRVSANTQTEIGMLTAMLDDVFKGARQVKAYGMEAFEQRRADSLFEGLYRLFLKAVKTRSRNYPIMEILGGLAIAAIIAYGGYQVLNGETTVGRFMAFFAAMIMAYQPMRSLANLNASLQEGLAAAQRILSMIDYRPTITNHRNAKPLKVDKGNVTLNDTTFSYVPEKIALANISINIPAGATVALVGSSGAGKSTILNLIPRFYDADSGSISIDGQDIKDVTLESLRASIGLVSQETGLFNDTVRMNIEYGRLGASEDDIINAAKSAAAHEFIMALPNGYDSVVGERGMKLSGGQRQRLSIARAMLKNAPILLLDEATSALDTESEQAVQTALRALMHNRTTLVIAHRLSTVVDADLIYVLNEGRVVESGTHDELLALDGTYAQLSRLQFRELEPDRPATSPAPVAAQV
jgi:ATP-binding cassette, subfamily B, bacterial MsbA